MEEESRASWLRSALARWVRAQSDKNPSPGLTASVSLAAEKRAARCTLGPWRSVGRFSVLQIHFWFRKRQADERQKEEKEKQNSCCKHNGLPSQPGDSDSCPNPASASCRVSPQPGFPRKQTPASAGRFLFSSEWHCPGGTARVTDMHRRPPILLSQACLFHSEVPTQACHNSTVLGFLSCTHTTHTLTTHP